MTGVLIVTGGSRGIGAATARAGGARGYAVCVNYRSNGERAGAVVESIIENGGQAIAVQGNVAEERDVLRVFQKVDHAFGPVTALVNNAGAIGRLSRVEDVTPELLTEVLAVNVIGGFLCAREAIRRMSTRHGGEGGAVVNLSSVAARLGAAGDYVHLAASKGAVESFTIGLSREVAAEGVRVNAVRPGMVDTEIHGSVGRPGQAHEIASQLPMRRPGEPEEVAATILWLLSDEASYVSGAIVDVSGAR